MIELVGCIMIIITGISFIDVLIDDLRTNRKIRRVEVMKTIKFKGYEWIKLGENEGKTRLFLKNILDKETLEKCVEDKWYLDDNKVILSENIKSPFDWENSYAKKVILENFKKNLGIECDIDLISKEEVERLKEDIKICNDCYWTKTAIEYEKFGRVFFVYASGCIDDNYTVDTNGLRPVIQLDTKLLKQNNDTKRIDRNTDEMVMSAFKTLYNQINEVANKLDKLIDKINSLKEK